MKAVCLLSLIAFAIEITNKIPAMLSVEGGVLGIICASILFLIGLAQGITQNVLSSLIVA